MDNPLTQLKLFFELADDKMLSGSDQLLYLHLFNLFNRRHWPETVRIADEDMKVKMRLHDSTGKPASKETIRNAKARLKLKGFIDFKSGKGSKKTEYRLLRLYPADTPIENPATSPITTVADMGACSVYPAHEDAKTLRQRQFLQQQQQTRAPARACESQKISGNGNLLSSRQIPNEDEKISTEEEISDEVRNAWRRYASQEPNEGACYELHILERKYGAEKVADAIRQAWIYKKYGDINLNLVRGQLTGRFKQPEGSKNSEGEQQKNSATTNSVKPEAWELEHQWENW